MSFFIIFLIVAGIFGSFGLIGYGVSALKAREPSKMIKPKEPATQIGKAVSNAIALANEPVYEMFGHPGPPIPLMAAALPSAPLGYGWEITTPMGVNGNPALSVALMDLRTSQIVEEKRGDMVVVRTWKYAEDDTYAAFYRRAAEISGRQVVAINPRRGELKYADPSKLQGKVMMANLIAPLADWARVLTLRYIVEHPDETKCHYMLIESIDETQPERQYA